MWKMATTMVFDLLLISSISYSQNQNSPFHFEIRQIQKDIYLAFRPDPLRFIVEGNCTIIVNEDDVVVVDASGSPQGARQIISEIKKITDKPVKYLVNTHGHGDHTIGNYEFAKAFPGLMIISHPGTRDYLTASTGGINYVKDIAADINSRIDYMNEEIKKVEEEKYPGFGKVVANLKQYRDYDLPLRQETYKKVIITPPNLTFQDSLTLFCGDREIRLIHIGKGDTASDVWVYLPKERILCSADAIVHPIPYGFSRFGLEWIETLRKARSLDFNTLVPGHGEVQKGKDYMDLYILLLESIHDQIAQGIKEGDTKDQVINGIDIKDIEMEFTGGDALLRYYFSSYFKKPQFDRMYDEMKGN